MASQAAKKLSFSPSSSWLVPAAVGLLAAGFELGGAGLRETLRYARGPLAEGELWRLVTGHLVHLGPSHMLMNVAALAVLAWLFAPWLRPRDWLLTVLSSALVIDAGLFCFSPGITWYVGLSGVLHGIWAAGSVRILLARQLGGLPLALLLVGKLGYETLIGAVPFTGRIAAGPVVTEAHAWGALGGVLAALIGFAITQRRRASL